MSMTFLIAKVPADVDLAEIDEALAQAPEIGDRKEVENKLREFCADAEISELSDSFDADFGEFAVNFSVTTKSVDIEAQGGYEAYEWLEDVAARLDASLVSCDG